MDHSLSCNCLRLTFSASHFLRTTPQLGTRSPTANLDADLMPPHTCSRAGQRKASPRPSPYSPPHTRSSQPAWQQLQAAAFGWNTARPWWHRDTVTIRAFSYQPALAHTFIMHLLLTHFLWVLSVYESDLGVGGQMRLFCCICCIVLYVFQATINWKQRCFWLWKTGWSASIGKWTI